MSSRIMIVFLVMKLKKMKKAFWHFFSCNITNTQILRPRKHTHTLMLLCVCRTTKPESSQIMWVTLGDEICTLCSVITPFPSLCLPHLSLSYLFSSSSPCFLTSNFSSPAFSSSLLISPLALPRLAPLLLRPVRKYLVFSYWIGCFTLAALHSLPAGLLGNDNKIEIS